MFFFSAFAHFHHQLLPPCNPTFCTLKCRFVSTPLPFDNFLYTHHLDHFLFFLHTFSQISQVSSNSLSRQYSHGTLISTAHGNHLNGIGAIFDPTLHQLRRFFNNNFQQRSTFWPRSWHSFWHFLLWTTPRIRHNSLHPIKTPLSTNRAYYF